MTGSPLSKDRNWETPLSSSTVGPENILYLDNYRQASHSIRGEWKERKMNELNALARECTLHHEAFDTRSASFATTFLESLPFDIEPPAIGVEDSGKILFEWFLQVKGEDSPTLFSVVFGRKNYIFSLTTANDLPLYGALNDSRVSLEFLLSQIKNYFAIASSHARFKTR